MSNLTRKDIKRNLALLRSNAEGGADTPDLPEGFEQSFSSQVLFRGWINYHVTWDVSDDDPWTIISLERSREQEWHDALEDVVPVITEEGILSAAEYREKTLNGG